MQRQWVRVRTPMGRAVKAILIINVAIYFVELLLAYLLGFDAERLAGVIHPVSLRADDVTSGYVWQIATYMWVHDPDQVFHVGFNMLVLYFFGPALEARWGTRRFVKYYLIFGLGAGLVIFLTGLLWPLVFGGPQPPTLGASGAIAGLVAAYCIYHWRSVLHMFFFRMKGRTLLLVFIGIDLLRLVWGEPIAVQGHWGGMATAAAVIRPSGLDPKLLRLRFKRWRLKRRLRLKRGRKSNGDDRLLH